MENYDGGGAEGAREHVRRNNFLFKIFMLISDQEHHHLIEQLQVASKTTPCCTDRTRSLLAEQLP